MTQAEIGQTNGIFQDHIFQMENAKMQIGIDMIGL